MKKNIIIILMLMILAIMVEVVGEMLIAVKIPRKINI